MFDIFRILEKILHHTWVNKFQKSMLAHTQTFHDFYIKIDPSIK